MKWKLRAFDKLPDCADRNKECTSYIFHIPLCAGLNSSAVFILRCSCLIKCIVPQCQLCDSFPLDDTTSSVCQRSILMNRYSRLLLIQTALCTTSTSDVFILADFRLPRVYYSHLLGTCACWNHDLIFPCRQVPNLQTAEEKTAIQITT